MLKGSFNMTLTIEPNLMSLALIISEKSGNLPYLTFDLDRHSVIHDVKGIVTKYL